MESDFLKVIRHNCQISDAKDSGIYSMCMLFLRLRNLYKWEKGLPPWQEPEPPELLDWISAREEFWEEIQAQPFGSVPVGGSMLDPFDCKAINAALPDADLVYGAGYGRQMKSVFFLARLVEERQVEGCPTVVLGREEGRELASPFAMTQDGVIFFRKEPFRFFLWDRIHEALPSAGDALVGALQPYGLLKEGGGVDLEGLRQQLDFLVDQEMEPIIHHEVGEMRDISIDAQAMEAVYTKFSGTAAELFVRGLKDILSDLHPQGMLGHILTHEKSSSLGFYLLFLDGLRKVLFPELAAAYTLFCMSGDWDLIRKASDQCLTNNLHRAEILADIGTRLPNLSEEQGAAIIEKELLCPFGLEMPKPEKI